MFLALTRSELAFTVESAGVANVDAAEICIYRVASRHRNGAVAQHPLAGGRIDAVCKKRARDLVSRPRLVERDVGMDSQG